MVLMKTYHSDIENSNSLFSLFRIKWGKMKYLASEIKLEAVKIKSFRNQ